MAVLNPRRLIPNKMDCVIGTRFFEVQFEVEPYDNSLGGPNSARNDGNDGNDGDNKEYDEDMEDGNK